MKFAILSDLHANRQALSAVMADVQHVGVDMTLCLGDVVGYGPAPVQVLEEVYSRIQHVAVGNHEAALAGTIDDRCFHDDAKRLLDWTRKRLGDRAMEFVGNLPKILRGPDFLCTHGDFQDPMAFHYVHKPSDASASWTATREKLLFVGHTHRPSVLALKPGGETVELPTMDFDIMPEWRYLINAGSVGHPRDGNNLASWVLYDHTKRRVFFRRVAYDWDGFRHELNRAGFPSGTAKRWEQIPEAMPVRERPDFGNAVPLLFPSHAPKKAPPSEPITSVPAASTKNGAYRYCRTSSSLASVVYRPPQKWRMQLGFLLGGVGIILGAAITMLVMAHQRRIIEPTDGGQTWSASTLPPTTHVADAAGNLVHEPEPIGELSADNRLREWEVWLGDSTRQKVFTSVEDGATLVQIAATGDAGWELRSHPIPNMDGARLIAAMSAFIDGGNADTRAVIELVEERLDGQRFLCAKKELRTEQSTRWSYLRFTTPKRRVSLAPGTTLRLVVHGCGPGTVKLRNLRLSLKE